MDTPADFPHSPLHTDTGVSLPAAAYLRYENRADGWSPGRQAAFLAHLADNGLVADAARSVGMSLGGGYALRRQARGFGFALGWEAALLIARRIVADNLMTAAIKGEQSRWIREEGVTTYVRQNTKLSLALLDRVDPANAPPEVTAIMIQFDWYLRLIEDGVSPADLWSLFFDAALDHYDYEARERVRAGLLLCEESDDFEDEDAEDDAPMEYKSADGGRQGCAREGAKARRDGKLSLRAERSNPAAPPFWIASAATPPRDDEGIAMGAFAASRLRARIFLSTPCAPADAGAQTLVPLDPGLRRGTGKSSTPVLPQISDKGRSRCLRMKGVRSFSRQNRLPSIWTIISAL